ALQLSLGYLRAALDPAPLGLVVELFLGATPRLALTRTLLVHGRRGDLLRAVGRASLLLFAFLDVFVLAFALCAPCLLWHEEPLSLVGRPVVPNEPGM